MVTIESIELENFLNVESAEIPFANQGFVLVVGENGNGKSALFTEAPFYSLYGESFRYGPRPGRDVIRKGQSRFLCSAQVRVDGVGLLTICRARKQKKPDRPDGLSVWLDGKNLARGSEAATQELLNDLFAMGPKTFVNSVLFTKDTLQFPLLPDTKKKEILDDLLRLGALDRARKAGETTRKEAAASIATLQSRLELHRERLPEIKEEIASLKKRNDAWNKEHASALKVAVADVAKTQKASKDAQTAEGEARKTLSANQTASAATQKKVDLARESLRVAREAYIKNESSIQAKIDAQDRVIRDFRGQIEGRTALLGHTCPKCGQVVGKTVKEWITEQQDKLRAAEEDLAVLKSKLSELADEDNRLEELVERLRKMTTTYEGEQEAVTKASGWLDRCTSRRETAEEQETIASERHKAMAEQTNHLRPQLEDAEGRLTALQAKITREVGQLEEQQGILKDEQVFDACFGNKGARLLLLDRVVPKLNADALRFCAALETPMSVTFNVRSSDQSYAGTFDVNVENPLGASDYRGDSSGERRRVDLVLLFSLLRLAGSRGARSFNQSIFDEPFENLDVMGQEAVLRMLRQEAQGKSSTFVITHSAFEMASSAQKVWEVNRGGRISFGS